MEHVVRPDQFRFNQFCNHFAKIDVALQRFALKHGFSIDENLHRQPARDLRRFGLPLIGASKPHVELIGIYLADHWLQIEWHEDLIHNMGIALYYQPDEGKRLYKRFLLVERQPFSYIQAHLEPLLIESLNRLDSIPPPVLSKDDPDGSLQGWQRTLA